MRRVFPDHRRTKQKTASRQSTARSYWGSAMSANGMVGRALAPPVIEAGKEYQGQRTWCCDARSTSATGHSRPTHSVPVPTDVRYAPESGSEISPYLYRARNLVERFFNRIKQCRRVATRYDRLAANYLAFIQLASIRLWLRVNESAP